MLINEASPSAYNRKRGFAIDDFYHCFCRRCSETAVKLAVPNKEYAVHSNRPPPNKIGAYGRRAPVNARVRYNIEQF